MSQRGPEGGGEPDQGAGEPDRRTRGGRARLRAALAWPRGQRRLWWVSFGLFAALGCFWALASPLLSVPDEPTHLVKAVAVVRGQFHGEDRVVDGYKITEVRVPDVFSHTGPVPTCFLNRPNQPAGCAPDVSGGSRQVPANTYVGTYQPTYYLLVGWPSLLTVSASAVYGIRLVSALLTAALLASAVASAAAVRRSRILVTATVFAVTPMVVFLAGAINPSGMEIAAALATWTTLLAVGALGSTTPTRLLVRAVVACCLLVGARPLSPLWLALIAGLVALALGWERVKRLLADRRVLVATGVVVAASVLAVAWILVVGALENFPGARKGVGLARDLRTSAGRSTELFEQMIGVFGGLDTPVPASVIFLFVLGLGGLGYLALAVGKARDQALLLGTAALVLVLPIALEAPRAESSGFVWQGRYTLPLAVGVPVLCGWILAERADGLRPVLRRLGRPLLAAFFVIHLAAHLSSTHRYVVGVDGTPFYFGRSGWEPPLPTWVLAVAFAAVLGAIVVWFDRVVGADPSPSDDRVHPRGPASPPVEPVSRQTSPPRTAAETVASTADSAPARVERRAMIAAGAMVAKPASARSRRRRTVGSGGAPARSGSITSRTA